MRWVPPVKKPGANPKTRGEAFGNRNTPLCHTSESRCKHVGNNPPLP